MPEEFWLSMLWIALPPHQLFGWASQWAVLDVTIMEFDPLQQKEFYEYQAFFNNINERGKDSSTLTPPFITATASQQEELVELDQRLKEARLVLADMDEEINSGQQVWEDS